VGVLVEAEAVTGENVFVARAPAHRPGQRAVEVEEDGAQAQGVLPVTS
jgi:hypothetical protein